MIQQPKEGLAMRTISILHDSDANTVSQRGNICTQVYATALNGLKLSQWHSEVKYMRLVIIVCMGWCPISLHLQQCQRDDQRKVYQKLKNDACQLKQ